MTSQSLQIPFYVLYSPGLRQILCTQLLWLTSSVESDSFINSETVLLSGWTDKTILAERVSEKRSETEAVFNHLVVFLSYRIVMSMFTFLWFGLSIPPLKLFFVFAVHIIFFNYPEFPSSVFLSHAHATHIFCLAGLSPLFLSVSVCCLCLSQLVSPAVPQIHTHIHTLKIHMHNCPLKGKPFSRGCQSLTLQLALGSWLLTSCNECICVWGCMCQKYRKPMC